MIQKLKLILNQNSFPYSSSNDRILSKTDTRSKSPSSKKKINLITEIPFEIILRANSILPMCKIKITQFDTILPLQRHEDAKTNFFKVIPRGNDFDITLRIKTRHQTLFHQRIRLTKTRCTLLPFFIPTKLSIYLPVALFLWPQIRQTQENNRRRSGALPPDPPGIAFITFLPGTRLCRRLLRITATLSSRLIRHPRVRREFTARIVQHSTWIDPSIRLESSVLRINCLNPLSVFIGFDNNSFDGLRNPLCVFQK